MYNYVKSNYVKNIINSKRLSYSCKHLSSNKKYKYGQYILEMYGKIKVSFLK